ncbi:uncharacterized protein LOC110648339 isoform X2 [Hevea brasiliensis]|uniref:uncharacterized protein LOC110648339 isoform X2 n=1 Tax=Hevea brasiliensis TaxID=3981 RepID=UPI0025D5391C|nr:uncharacterized protein LOC110648339 isoform X2 [Hevea brasiliensis]
MMKTSLSSAWLPRDLGFSCWVVDANRCKRLLENVEATFMGEAPWTAMTCFISRSRWKPKRMQNAFFVGLRNGRLLHLKAASLADSSLASVPLPLRVEPKPKSGIRQQDLLKKVVEVKPKRPKVSNHSYGNHSTRTSCDHSSAKSAKSDQEEKECSLLKSGKTDEIKEENAVKNDTGQENTVKSLLGLAYASSDDEDVE